MIKDQAAFETALEHAAALYSDPDYKGPRLDEQLSDLLAEIAMFEPELAPSSRAAFSDLRTRAQALVRKAAALQPEFRERAHPSTFPQDGHGIGPTTGV
jgi:xanthine/CO dehydrogenase XdhC/CoxF family maturation factor